METVEIKSAQKIRLSTGIRFRAVEDEGVLVHLRNSRALVVNGVGMHILEALGRHQTMTVAELAETVASTFEVSADRAQSDVAAFIAQLKKEEVVDIVGALDPKRK